MKTKDKSILLVQGDRDAYGPYNADEVKKIREAIGTRTALRVTVRTLRPVYQMD